MSQCTRRKGNTESTKYKKDINQRIFLCAEESLKRLVEVAEHNGFNCRKHQKCRVVTARFHCDERK